MRQNAPTRVSFSKKFPILIWYPEPGTLSESFPARPVMVVRGDAGCWDWWELVSTHDPSMNIGYLRACFNCQQNLQYVWIILRLITAKSHIALSWQQGGTWTDVRHRTAAGRGRHPGGYNGRLVWWSERHVDWGDEDPRPRHQHHRCQYLTSVIRFLSSLPQSFILLSLFIV